MILAVDAKGWLQLGYSATGITSLVDAFVERERERDRRRLLFEKNNKKDQRG